MMAIRLVGMRPNIFKIIQMFSSKFPYLRQFLKYVFVRPNFDSRGKANASKYVYIFPFY